MTSWSGADFASDHTSGFQTNGSPPMACLESQHRLFRPSPFANWSKTRCLKWRGGDAPDWCMPILRHEAAHALDKPIGCTDENAIASRSVPGMSDQY